MSSAILQFVGWSYLPDFATKQVLGAVHQILYRFFHISPPQFRSPAYGLHYRYTFAAVVLCYLTYNFIDASSGLPKNFYELLEVHPNITDNALKIAFRTFARKHHPDRVGPQGEAHFIAVRDAFEALKDPVVRFAYDRFGPDVLHWKECNTMKEYLRRGLLSSVMYHVMTGAVLVLFSVVGKPSPIATWRYLLFIGALGLELYLILAPSPSNFRPSSFIDQAPTRSTIFNYLFPRRVAYQHVLLVHQIFIFMSVALSRVGPVLFSSLLPSDPAVEQQMVRVVAERFGMLAKTTERELSIMLNMELHAIHQSLVGGPAELVKPPEKPDVEMMQALSMEMEDIIVENKLKGELGPMRSAWDTAVQKAARRKGRGDVCKWVSTDSLQRREMGGVQGRHARARSLSF
ncbi:DnaJ-domain-containing protein [Phlebopus sp. FC_14]|nr:DnaJ-domain-containing protein [Phlebopus sp. FC_14]